MEQYYNLTSELATLVDFLRFGMSEANRHTLFYGHGTDNAYDDMTHLILGSLALPPDSDPVLLTARLTHEERQHLQTQLAKRIFNKIPVPYLTNKAYFCGLSFYVDERVLIPRSPIAEMIGQGFAPWVDAYKVERILDLCTGSGCLAIACCYAFPEAHVDAVDLSKDALDVALINQKQHGLEDNLTLIHSDCWENVPKTRYDIILSNPPYVSDAEMETLPREYTHEPDMALRTDNNGLSVVEKILEKALDYLTDEGILVVEVGNSEEALLEHYPEMPFTWVEFEHGGQGVFVVTCEQLKDYQKAKS